jgi:hypothetical protein
MRGEGLPEEVLGGSDAAVLAQQEVDGSALLVDPSNAKLTQNAERVTSTTCKQDPARAWAPTRRSGVPARLPRHLQKSS